MLDQKLNFIFKPVLKKFATILLKYQISPNQITLFSFILGIFCFIFLSLGMIYIALIFFILNRFFDGVDGTLARLKKPTDLGGFYDIISDFLIYALLPFGFILFDNDNFLSMSLLLTSFIGTCATFLTTAWIFEKKKIKIEQLSKKSFFYSEGLIEGAETIIFFILMFVFYELASFIAWIFALLCFLTAIMRVVKVSKILNSIN